MEKSESVERAARKVEGVVDVYSTNGMYDLILRAQGEDELTLGHIVKKIKRIAGVTATLTSIVYDSGSKKSSVVVKAPFYNATKDGWDSNRHGIMLWQR
jgi:DNA-binding Lrp family transcriptional regulator